MADELFNLYNKIKEEISNVTTFHAGIDNLLHLRKRLFDILIQFKAELCQTYFNAIPYIGADGFHNKIIA